MQEWASRPILAFRQCKFSLSTQLKNRIRLACKKKQVFGGGGSITFRALISDTVTFAQFATTRGSKPASCAYSLKNLRQLAVSSQYRFGFILFDASREEPAAQVNHISNTSEVCEVTYLRGSVSAPSSFAPRSPIFRSGRRRCSVGYFGFLLVSRNPWCLKLTISPLCGFQRLLNSVVPAAAVNRMPFGLTGCHWISMIVNVKSETEAHAQFAFPLMPTDASNDLRLSVPEFLSRGYVSLDYHELGGTLCLRKPGQRPGWNGARGLRRMTPSPPLSMTSWKKRSI